MMKGEKVLMAAIVAIMMYVGVMQFARADHTPVDKPIEVNPALGILIIETPEGNLWVCGVEDREKSLYGGCATASEVYRGLIESGFNPAEGSI